MSAAVTRHSLLLLIASSAATVATTDDKIIHSGTLTAIIDAMPSTHSDANLSRRNQTPATRPNMKMHHNIARLSSIFAVRRISVEK
jgi:hypothetical protein